MDLSHIHNRWLAVQVKVGREFAASASVRNRGYDDFLPLYECKEGPGGRVKQVPLFPGYCFVRFDADNKYPIVKAPDVIRLVGTSSSPTPVEDSEIEALRITHRTGTKCQPCAFVDIGQRVQISNGSLAGLRGIVVRVKHQQRLVITVQLLRQSVFLELGTADVSITTDGVDDPVNLDLKRRGSITAVTTGIFRAA
jgi:transcription antitermination factor NusG